MQFIYKIAFYLLLATLVNPVFANSVITITNGNIGKTSGFNDPTPFTPVGGNNATTLGQARLNALQYAANKLSIKLNSSVRIDIFATFSSKGGSSQGAILAGTSIDTHFDNFANAPKANILYHIALAEKLSGSNMNDITPFKSDLRIDINSDIDGSVALGNQNFYYGFDARPQNRDIDFVTVLIHEIIHGIGFSTPVRTDLGLRRDGKNDTFMINLENHGVIQPDYGLMSIRERILAGISNNLHWIGAALLAKADPASGFKNGHAVMYAPSQYEPGSSVSHFNPSFGPTNELMTPSYMGPNHDIGFAAQVLEDVGWGILNTNSTTTDLTISIVDSNTEIVPGVNEVYSVVVENRGTTPATGIVVSNFLPDKSVFVSATPASNGSCDTKNVIQNKIVTCSLAALPASGTAIFNITTNFVTPGTQVFNANVESLNLDTVNANNTASEPTTIAFSKIQAPPVIIDLNNFSVIVAQTINIIVTAVDPNGDIPILSATGLPANSTFAPKNDGTGTFSWIPTSTGVFTIAFTANDGNSAYPDATDRKVLQITVTLGSTRPPRAKPNNQVPSGGCSLSSSSPFDPLFPLMLLLLSILYCTRHYYTQRGSA